MFIVISIYDYVFLLEHADFMFILLVHDYVHHGSWDMNFNSYPPHLHSLLPSPSLLQMVSRLISYHLPFILLFDLLKLWVSHIRGTISCIKLGV